MRGLAAIAAAVVIFSALPALADDPRARAREHFEEGRRLYQVGEYAPALVEFKRAFLFKEDAVLIFNIAQCHRQLGDTKQALTFYRRYLATDPPAANRQQVQKMIADLERAPAPEAPPPPPPRLTAPPEPAPVRAPVAAVAAPQSAAPPDEPFYGRWWFWTGAAMVVAGGVAAAMLVGRGTSPSGCSRGVDYCASLPR